MKHKDPEIKEIQHETQEVFSVVAPGEVILGSVVEINELGQVLVDYHLNPINKSLVAVSTLGLTKKHIGRQVALLFESGDPGKPVIMGLIHSPLQEMLENYELTPVENSQEEIQNHDELNVDNATIDGKRIVLEGKEEIVLKCGEASITLTKAGKILIRGKYLLNRSTGVNRIMGGSVQVN